MSCEQLKYICNTRLLVLLGFFLPSLFLFGVYLVLQKHDIFNLLFPLGLKELHPFAPWDDISTFSLVMAVTCISGGFLAQVTTAFLSEATNDLRRAASLKVISLYELIIVITSSIMIRRVILYGENVPEFFSSVWDDLSSDSRIAVQDGLGCCGFFESDDRSNHTNGYCEASPYSSPVFEGCSQPLFELSVAPSYVALGSLSLMALSSGLGFLACWYFICKKQIQPINCPSLEEHRGA